VHGKIVSGAIYRRLYLAGYAGLQASGNFTGMTVMMGETSPVGVRVGNIPPPLAFLRAVLCLNSRYHMSSSCGMVPIGGWAQHPYTEKQGPNWVPPSRDDVSIGTLGRLVTALNKAAAAGAIPANVPVYITEFGIESRPDPNAVTLARQAEYLAISEHLAWLNPRVASYAQYQLADSAPARGGPFVRWASFEAAGLELLNGQPKPAYNGWRLPLTATVSRSTVSFWGFVRPTTAATSVTLEYSKNGGATWMQQLVVQTNALGYWTATGPYVKGRVWRVEWTSPDATVYDGATTRAYTRSVHLP
jgi:hypothetical protein